MMPGMIMLWYGSVATIPSGWALCDGANNTPNLVSRFVIGAKFIPAPGATGGSASHSHDFVGDGHSHDLTSGIDIADAHPDGAFAHKTSTVPATGTTDLTDGRPPYHALCYIMKLPIP